MSVSRENSISITPRQFLIFSLIAFNSGAMADCNNAIPRMTPDEAFAQHADGTVTHNATGLMWMRCEFGQTWDGAHCNGTAQGYTWQGALQATEIYSFAGYSDWRLPNKNELASIVEEACYAPAINSVVFPDVSASTANVHIDLVNKLVWQDDSQVNTSLIYEDAEAFCNNLTLDDKPKGTWRLPTKSEAEALFANNYSASLFQNITGPSWTSTGAGSPPCDITCYTYQSGANYSNGSITQLLYSRVSYSGGYKSVTRGSYPTRCVRAYVPQAIVWSSSPSADSSSQAWGVSFYDGYVGNFNKTDYSRVRLVRGGE